MPTPSEDDVRKAIVDVTLARSALASGDYFRAGEMLLDALLVVAPVELLSRFLTDQGAKNAETAADAAEEAKLLTEGKESAQAEPPETLDTLPATEPE